MLYKLLQQLARMNSLALSCSVFCEDACCSIIPMFGSLHVIWKEAWFELVIIRSDQVKKIQAGFSGLLVAALSTFFGGQGHDISRSGITLKLVDGVYQQIFMTSAGFSADEAALHYAYCCKGASGLKPCLLCANVFNHKIRNEIVRLDATGASQHHTTHDFSKLKLHTPASISAILENLAASCGTLSKGAFAELETRLGWNYVPGSVMYDPILRPLMDPTEKAVYDWMHIFFVHGVFGAHVGQLMYHLKEHGVT